MEKVGIYQIVNKVNQKKYIGSSIRLQGRKKRHFSELNCNIHHSQVLQRAYNKYGKDNFDFFILEYCEVEKLLEREQYYIDTLKPEYNICLIAGNCLGTKNSEETIQKKKESNKKYWDKVGRPYKDFIKEKRKINSIIREERKQRDLLIIKDLEYGIRQDEISKKYNLSPSVITQLKKKHCPDIDNRKIRRGQNNNFSKLTEEQVREIKHLLKDKIKQQIIADKYNVKLRTIKAIQSGQNWKHVTTE